MADLTDDVVNKLIDSINSLNRNVLKGTSATEKNTKASEKTKSSSGGSSTKTGDAKVIQDLINENKKLSGIVGSMQKKFQSLDKGVSSTISSFKKIEGSTKTAAGAISALGAAMGAGGVLGAMVSSLSDATKTYQDLSQIGQTFGGSMLQMQIAAANAALPLGLFAEALKKNSVVVASIGANAFGSMSKALREGLSDLGQLGLTSGQLNDYLGTYLETQRLYGNLNNQTTEKAAANMKVLSVETAKAAQMTGVSTEAINKMASTALRDESLRARLLQMNSDGQNNYGMAMNKAIIYMSALPGEAGKTLSTMLAQTAGRGSAIMSDASNTFIEAGLFGVTSLMDNMAQKVANNTWNDQDAADFNRKFVAEGMKNMATLQFQAATGNKAASQAIVMISEMKELANKTPEELAKAKNVTKFLENLGFIIDKITGSLKVGFFNALDNFMKGFDNFEDNPTFKDFFKKIEEMGGRLGKFVSETLTPEKLIAMGEAVAKFVEGGLKFGGMLLDIISPIASTFGWLTDKLGLFGAALVTWTAWQATKMAGRGVAAYGGKIKDLLAEKFNIGGPKPETQLTTAGVQNAFEHALAKFSAGNALRVIDIRHDNNGPDFDPGERGKKGKKGRRTRRTGRPSSRLGQAAGEAAGHIDPSRLPQPHTPQVPHVAEGPKTGRLDRIADAMEGFRERSHTKIVNVIRNPRASARAGVQATGRGLSAAGRGAGNFAARGGRSVLRGSANAARGAGRLAARAGGAALRGGAGLARGIGTLARGIGPGALVGAGVSAALSFAPDFKGKETIQTMAEFAAMGSMLGPIGTAVGAGIGAIYANWDDLSGMMSSAFQGIKNFDYGAPFKALGNAAVATGSAIWGAAKTVWGWWGDLAGFVGKGFTAVKNFDYAGALKTAGNVVGAIGGALGTGAMAVWNAWGSMANVYVNAFKTVRDFDYSGALKSAGDMLGSIGDTLGNGASTLWNAWGGVKDLVSNAFTSIKDFDYAGAFNTAASMLGPIGEGVKWYVDTVWESWKKVGNLLKDGWSSIKNGITGAWDSLMGNNNAALDSMNKAVQPPKVDLATPITQKFTDYTKDITSSFADLNDASQTALQTVSTPTDLTKNQNVDLFNVTNPATASITGPNKPKEQAVPEINTDSIVAQQSEWKTQALALQKDNLETKQQMAQMLDVLSSGSAQQVGGLRDLINEQQKSNRSLDTVASGII